MAKHKSGELRSPATALIYVSIYLQENKDHIPDKKKKKKKKKHRKKKKKIDSSSEDSESDSGSEDRKNEKSLKKVR